LVRLSVAAPTGCSPVSAGLPAPDSTSWASRREFASSQSARCRRAWPVASSKRGAEILFGERRAFNAHLLSW